MASKEQVSRLFALVPFLQAHPDAELAATAAVFGITVHQLVADLNVLWFCGLPGGMPGDLMEVDFDSLAAGRIRLSNAEYLSRPLRFTPDEALSLVVALRTLGDLGHPDLAEAVASALAKLEGAHGLLPTPAVSVVTATGSAKIRRLLSEAIMTRTVVDLTYDGMARAETTTPAVEPSRLAIRDGYAYLDAWSLDRGDWRVYRVDRIAEVRVTERPAQDRGEPPRFAPGWLDNLADAAEVTLVLAARARWITEYIPIRQSRRTRQGLAVTIGVADPAWLRALLLRLGSGVRRVEPLQAARSAQEAARETLALYDVLGRGANG
ncbi:MAG: WYL domain-containing protein [Propionicimonas sp.]